MNSKELIRERDLATKFLSELPNLDIKIKYEVTNWYNQAILLTKDIPDCCESLNEVTK